MLKISASIVGKDRASDLVIKVDNISLDSWWEWEMSFGDKC